MWYNKFNKWNWTKFENGVIQLKGEDKWLLVIRLEAWMMKSWLSC
jgi:hypothetical protein